MDVVNVRDVVCTTMENVDSYWFEGALVSVI
jgi:hypothetical protein